LFFENTNLSTKNIISVNVPKYYSIVSRKPDPSTTRQNGMEFQEPVSHYGDTTETPILLLPQHAEQILYKAHTPHRA